MSLSEDLQGLATADPMKVKALLWPDVYFYKQQRQIIYSAWDNDQTFAPAGNMLGKDFTAGFIVVAGFLTRYPCRIVTTSAKEDHLRVLWGEMGRYIQTSKYPLDFKKGGPLILNHQEIKRMVDGERCPISYVRGMVASEATEAAMQGHHCAKSGHRPTKNGESTPDGVWRTLFLADECSSVPHTYWRLASTWAHRMLAIGNTWPCENFFKYAVKGKPGTDDRGGDIPRKFTEDDQKRWVSVYKDVEPDKLPMSVTTRENAPNGYVRKIVQIRATDSPNVRLALAEIAAGKDPSGEILVPGVKDWNEYQKNLIIWDEMEQSVSLNAEFYEGSTIKLFPDAWLTRAEELASTIKASKCKRVARGMGVDPAEGGDKSAWVITDELGVIDCVSMKTPDTNKVVTETLSLMFRYGLTAEQVVFDRGGGGKEHADRLRASGHNVRTMGFGESVTPDPRRGYTSTGQKVDQKEHRYAYFNRRAEMYGELSEMLNPAYSGFAIPRWFGQFRLQLYPIPKVFDSEGRLKLPPKNKSESGSSKTVCLVDLIGHSPDEADALVLAVYAMSHKPVPLRASVSSV